MELQVHLAVCSLTILCSVAVSAHGSAFNSPNKPRPPEKDVIDNDNEHLSDDTKECVYISFDHDEFATRVMYCANGCCGTKNDQKCCKNTEQQDKRGDFRLLNIMIVVTGILVIVCVSCCVFGLYKHKMVTRRKTRPSGHNASFIGTQNRVASSSLFFTTRSASVPATGKVQHGAHTTARSSLIPTAPYGLQNPPPSYTERGTQQIHPHYDVTSPPPPYTPRLTVS